jgi:hypothetical protein
MHGRQLPRSGAAVLYCLALLMAAGVTACASAASSPAAGRGAPSPPPLGTVPTSGYTQAAAALPLAAYRLSEQDLTAIRNADEILIQRCMESKGFAYPVTLSSAGYALPANEPYGITDEAQAAARGYAQPGSGGLDPADGNGLPSLTQLQQEHGAAYVQALFGNTDEAGGSQQASGCINANKQLLSGGPQAHSDLSLAGELTTQSEQLTESDPRVRAVERAWQGCMKSKGFSFATPMQAQAASWPAEPDATEIATATADVQCKTSTNLPGTWLAVEAAYQRSLISSHESQLAELNLELQAEVQRATTLLDGKQG